MIELWKHFKTITYHKYLVAKGCFKIGLYNTKIPDESILENLKSQQKLSFNELQTYIKFLNLAIQNNKIKREVNLWNG